MQPDDRGATRLRETQRALARALRGLDATALTCAVFDAPATVPVADRLAVYRSNARQFFRTALALTYPVLQRRVGDDFFRQLATEYRAVHPSRSGDLHWVGAEFPGWLATRLRDTGYAWLADLARLEWACEEAAACAVESPATLQALGAIPPESLDGVRLGLQPSLRLVASDWPLWSVWQANQLENAAPVDLAAGPEHCACVADADAGVAVFRIDADVYGLLGALMERAPLAAAVAGSRTTPDVLARTLAWAFGEGLVVDVSPAARA